MKAELAANDYLACLSCGYSLQGLPAKHTCPECGKSYDARDAQQAWRHWLEKRKLPPNAIR
jgi:predicted RNA-binding Zn-ribbon protein involved in translation (DUF1610 family)